MLSFTPEARISIRSRNLENSVWKKKYIQASKKFNLGTLIIVNFTVVMEGFSNLIQIGFDSGLLFVNSILELCVELLELGLLSFDEVESLSLLVQSYTSEILNQSVLIRLVEILQPGMI